MNEDRLAIVEAKKTAGEEEDSHSEDIEEADDGSQLGQIFKTTRPSHIGSGLMSGAGNVVKGVGLGLAALVSAPVVGAYQEGAKGAVKGVGLGLVAAVALPIAGVYTGARQVYSGAANTKQAYKERGQGKIYNEKTSTWEFKYRRLSEVYRDSQAAYNRHMTERKSTKKRPGTSPNKLTGTSTKTVAETEFYDVLQVPTDAPTAEIRKAYYKLAREKHPDKNPGDEAAKEAFQNISEAYQVLSEPTTRAEYDKHGRKATENVDLIDSKLFFAILFGSEELYPFVGTLALGSILVQEESAEKGEQAFSLSEPEQNWRVAQIAQNLRDLCEPAVKAHIIDQAKPVEKWAAEMQALAASLCGKSFGWQMIDAIGFSYENYASHYLGKDSFLQFGTMKPNLKKTHKELNTIGQAVAAAGQASFASRKAEKSKKKTSKAPNSDTEADTAASAKTSALMEESIQHVLKIMLNMCLHDVLGTVRSACQLYLHDKSVNASEQKLRARVLQDLGTIFLSQANLYKKDHASESINFRDIMHEADVRLAQKMDERNSDNSSTAPTPDQPIY